MSEKSSYWYDSSPVKATTNEVLWVGGDIDCLGICNNSRLTTVQTKMANAICDLITTTNIDDIVIPECFKEAFATSNPVIVDFITLLLQTACTQKGQIETIEGSLETLNPLVSVDYKCCSDNPCVTTGVVKLNVALENIIQCICSLKEYVGVIPDGQTSVVGYITSLQNTVNFLTGIVNNYSNEIIALQNGLQTASAKIVVLEGKVNCIISNLDDQDLNPNSCTQI